MDDEEFYTIEVLEDWKIRVIETSSFLNSIFEDTRLNLSREERSAIKDLMFMQETFLKRIERMIWRRIHKPN